LVGHATLLGAASGDRFISHPRLLGAASGDRLIGRAPVSGAFDAELMVGQPALVKCRALFVQLRLRPVALRLPFGDPGAALRRPGALGAQLGFLAMAAGHLMAPLLELTLTRSLASLRPGTGQHEDQGDQHEYHYDDHDD
jgi:hypothetical protein